MGSLCAAHDGSRRAGVDLATIAATAAATPAAPAAASAASPTAEPAAAAAEPTTRALLGPRLVDPDRATIHLGAVERRDRCLGVCRRSHFDEGEAARLVGVAIRHDRDALNRPPVF